MTRVSKIVTATVASVAAVAAIIVYRQFDPAATKWFPKCPSKLFTGYDCPGCGSQRALHSLLNGDLAGAFRHNALFVPALVMVALIFASDVWGGRDRRLYRALTGQTACYVTLAVIIAWAVVRNIFAW